MPHRPDVPYIKKERPEGRSFLYASDILQLQIALYQHLQQLVPVDLADQRTGGVVVGDIGGILGENIAHDLVDGVVALLLQRLVQGGENIMHLRLLVLRRVELAGKFVHGSTTFPGSSITPLVYAIFPPL